MTQPCKSSTPYMYYNIKTERGVSKNEIRLNYGR